MSIATRSGKNIAIFCDGTGNSSQMTDDGLPVTTNVWKLYRAALDHTESQWRQVVWYDPGVGTGTSREAKALGWLGKLWEMVSSVFSPSSKWGGALRVLPKLRMVYELATGAGIEENIRQGYEQIVRHYQPGDRIFLFGFSRGAYTARCIAGVISRVGLLRSEYAYRVDDVYRQYRHHLTRGTSAEILTPEAFHAKADFPVALLGVWDTVASLGLPLWGWWFSLSKLLSFASINSNPAPVCKSIRHAVAMDERRSAFFVTMFGAPGPGQDVRQVWFRGAHGGVGGGYAAAGLSDIALDWMAEAAVAEGLLLRPEALAMAPNPLGPVICELDHVPAWHIMGTWPRWHPCQREDDLSESPQFGRLHPSVYSRSAHAESLSSPGAPLDGERMVFLDPGDGCIIQARGDRQWNRTGLVVEQGGLYRVTYLEGTWRDENAPPCGPDGQDARECSVRAVSGWTRRYLDPHTRWMELIGTVAHPRPWDLRELGVNRLLHYLLVKDPHELTDTLMSLGRRLAKVNDATFLRCDAESGMLYLFANDAWLFYGNNTGALTLRVDRLPPDAPCPGGCYQVATDGRVSFAS